MKVYLVLEGDYDGSFVTSVWSTREKAEEEAEALEHRYPAKQYYHYYDVEEVEVDIPLHSMV